MTGSTCWKKVLLPWWSTMSPGAATNRGFFPDGDCRA
jgi:hypothetical protein